MIASILVGAFASRLESTLSFKKYYFQIIAERRVVLESLSTQDEISESAFIQDKKTGKKFSFRKRKGKLVDFLDILLQTKV